MEPVKYDHIAMITEPAAKGIKSMSVTFQKEPEEILDMCAIVGAAVFSLEKLHVARLVLDFLKMDFPSFPADDMYNFMEHYKRCQRREAKNN